MNYTLIMAITAVLSLAGIVVAGFQVTKFHSKARQTLSIDRKAMLKAVRWVITGGCWTGFFVALTAILVTTSSQQVHMTALGTVALLLGIPTACIAILIVSFLAGAFQLYALVHSSAIREKEVEPNHDVS
jgi:hypothetical protein